MLTQLAWFAWALLLVPDTAPRQNVNGAGAPGSVRGTVHIQTELTSVSRARGSRYRSRGKTETDVESETKASPEVTNIVVFLEETETRRAYPPSATPARLVQKNTKFVPHVLPILKGTKVEIVNKDPYYHNVFSNADANRFNIGRQVTDAVVAEVFETAAFVPVFCDIHLDMSAYVVVLANPFFTQPNADGSFVIEGVPPGRYKVRLWHERLAGSEREIVVTDGGIVALDLTL